THAPTARSGHPPAPTLRLMEVSILRQQAHQAWIMSVEQKGKNISFVMNARARVKVDEVDDFLKRFHGRMKLRTEMNPVFVYDCRNTAKKELFSQVRDIILQINELIEK
ncbi:MAG: hypothetical protein LUF92_07575, partial [Clostridiales bacterium]|nr:hypothetical protein [Clostridiales bacterium]